MKKFVKKTPKWRNPETNDFIEALRMKKIRKDTTPNSGKPYAPDQEEQDNEAYRAFMKGDVFKSVMGVK